jgi:hypothetical protein
MEERSPQVRSIFTKPSQGLHEFFTLLFYTRIAEREKGPYRPVLIHRRERRTLDMWQQLSKIRDLFTRQKERVVEPGNKKMSYLGAPMTIYCRSRKCGAAFAVISEEMSPGCVTFSSGTYMDPGDCIDIRLPQPPSPSHPGFQLRGRVVSCIPGRISGKIAFQGTIDLASMEKDKTESLQRYIEGFGRNDLNCAWAL